MYHLQTVPVDSAKQLASLCAETFFQAYSDMHSTADIRAYCAEAYSVAAVEALLKNEDTAAVIAYSEAVPAGFYILRHCPCPIALSGPSAELKQIYVLARYFGGGLGKQLFDHAVQAAKQSGSQWLWLYVVDHNNRAQSFYKKLGFSCIGVGPVLAVGGDKLSSTVMCLEI